MSEPCPLRQQFAKQIRKWLCYGLEQRDDGLAHGNPRRHCHQVVLKGRRCLDAIKLILAVLVVLDLALLLSGVTAVEGILNWPLTLDLGSNERLWTYECHFEVLVEFPVKVIWGLGSDSACVL